MQEFSGRYRWSESAGRALDVAAAMAKAAHGTLKIVTVGESPAAPEQTDFRLTKTHTSDLSERLLQEAQQRAGWTGVKPVKTLQRWGDPAEAILDTMIRLWRMPS
nr:universal stress protein [Afipia sp. Root123D2]